MRKYIFVIVSLFFICGCNSCDEISRESLGKIIDANVIPGSCWIDQVKTQIKTESIFIVITGSPIINIGAEAFKITCDNNRKYFTWEGSYKQYQMR